MAKDTKFKLINSSKILFSERWYETVSVAEICRHAGLSNGVFYRYFKSKEAIFRAIVDDLLEYLRIELDVISGRTVAQRLHTFFTKVYRVCFDKSLDVTIFREGQYRFTDCESHLRDIYLSALEKVYGRAVDEAEYLYITAGLRFLNTRALYDKVEFNIEDIERFVLEGVFPGQTSDGLHFQEPGPFPLDLSDSASDRLIGAGLKLFGKQGYNNVNVFEIARDAGLSVGAFYLYFPSKEDFLARILNQIGHLVRFYLRSKQTSQQSSLNRELEGMWNFVNYFREHPEFYEIVREAEFVSRLWVQDYYDRFVQGYEKSMMHLDSAQSRVLANFLIGLNHYLGIELVLRSSEYDPADTIRRIGKFLVEGIPS